MRNKGFILLLTVVVSALCLYFLSLSLVSKGVEEKATAFATENGQLNHYKKQQYLDSVWKMPVYNFLGADYTYQEIKENELSLGLDLKGGMHVTLEVSPVEIIRAMAGGRKDAAFEKAITQAQNLQKTSQESFVDLFYRSYREIQPNAKLASVFASSTTRNINYNSTDQEVLAEINREVEDAIARSFNILRTRIDKFGVNQPNIQRLKGSGRIQIELPGVDNPERVRKLLQGTANLEFWEVWNVQEYGNYFTQLNDYLVKQEAANKLNPTAAAPAADNALASAAGTTDTAAAASTDTTALAAQLSKTDTAAGAAKDSINPNQSALLARLFTTLPGGLGTNVRDTAKVNALFAKPEVRAIFPQNLKFLWGVKPIVANDGAEFLELYAIKKGRDGKAPLTGEYISDARQDYDQSGRPEITMGMNAAGAKKWQRLTGENIGRQVAIVLDDYVYSAPVVQAEIGGGNSSISGNFTIEEAQDLANILKAGKMPAPTRIVEEAIVGPSLGQEAINQGLISSLAGMGLVVLFMFAYYSKGGLVANIALFFNIFFIIGILAQFGTALTLPGIAGMVLTMGMSVDANVLIFERIKEELAGGLGMQDAIKKGYSKAFSSIFDSNVTTMLAGIILFFFGSGPVKGFAVTLMIGIATSFFTAVYVSRLLVEWLTKNNKNLSLETALSRNWFKNIKFDILGNRKKAYIFSAAVIAFGIAAIFIKGELPLGVDFKGGRSYVVNFNNPVVASDVRASLDDEFQGAGTEVKTYGATNRLKITTSYIAEDESTQADETVRAALDQGLKQYQAENPTVVSSSKVGATMADDIQKTAVLAVVLAFAGIFLYLAFRFSRWQFSLGGVIALIHDVLIVFSAFTIANLFGISFEMDQVFIASILTIIGYSINDTVVVFDRIREYTTENPRMKFSEVVNPALNSTFSRTIITNLTVLLVVVVLFIFGGETLRGFSFAMLIGSLTGTYSTLFIAAPIVVDTTNLDKERPVVAKPVVVS
ncbi:protein translocase subunit SecDF [Rufibacter sp. LB8]|uniref:protein translocase subunit SecDF n=1 Tax=Rufibacter sp. LB8 TaxID=2777781 RepID=UPI00178C3A8D|nr:protein translocase subunit SecDF [Rufibacter sp. LB8]